MWIVIAVVVAIIGFAVMGFNRLRTADVGAQEALGSIDVQLTRRSDLIPHLVNTVRGYATHERAVFDEVTAARAGAVQAAKGGTIEEKSAAQSRLDNAVIDVLAVAAAYPVLKATAGFQQLQIELSDTENNLWVARQHYNEAVARLNTLVKTSPWLLLSSIAGVSAREFYDAPTNRESPPHVSF